MYIGNALHKAWIETNEVGTEAAAVTVVEMTMVPTSAHEEVPLRRAVFHADHPFLYLIRDGHTGVILFAGRVVEPATASLQSRPLPQSTLYNPNHRYTQGWLIHRTYLHDLTCLSRAMLSYFTFGQTERIVQ